MTGDPRIDSTGAHGLFDRRGGVANPSRTVVGPRERVEGVHVLPFGRRSFGEQHGLRDAPIPFREKSRERTRLRLLRESLALLAPQAPFVQFTYAVVPPIPKLAGVKVEASERIWRNMPPARVWVYRHA